MAAISKRGQRPTPLAISPEHGGCSRWIFAPPRPRDPCRPRGPQGIRRRASQPRPAREQNGIDRPPHPLTTRSACRAPPPQLIEFLHKIEDRQPYDRAAYEACLKDSINTVVRQQAQAGIDIISDGEFSKGRNWAFYVHDRLSGVATRPLT